MMSHRVRSAVLLLAVLLGSAECGSVGSTALPASPCPSIFRYAADSIKQQIYGVVDTRQQQVDKTGTLELHLSIAGELLSKYVGSIEAIEDNAQITEQFSKGRGVSYRINFPLQEPLPKLTKLVFNGRELCTGPGDRGSFVSSVTLRHFLRSDTCKDKCEPSKLLPPNPAPFVPPNPAPLVPPSSQRPETTVAPIAAGPGPRPTAKADGPTETGTVPTIQHEYQRTIERKEETTNPHGNGSSVKYIREEITYRKQVITPDGTGSLQPDELKLPSFVSGAGFQ
ncbi:serine protease gd-like [Anopheles cruzii]|uniref:serine protease gd-like n=1 Tax=Anopheles cruzii TaxID=68878 RepID=UPI0022EC59FE|nr:serine protease gd-like [Anopheles cruzii]